MMDNGIFAPRELPAGIQNSRKANAIFRGIVQIAGFSTALLFIFAGTAYGLQLFADGSIFSYGIAAEDGWAFHWHNISSRLTVFLYAHLPAQAYVGLTGDGQGGVFFYGLLFFSAPLAGLLITCLADRTPDRIFLTVGCLSTATLCPFVFGFPTEMWVGHSLFWPALAMSHSSSRRMGTAAGMLSLYVAMVLTHASGLVFAASIIGVLFVLRGTVDPRAWRATVIFGAACVAWAGVRLLLPPDNYFAAVLPRGALSLFDATNLTKDSAAVLLVGLTVYAVALGIGRRVSKSVAGVKVVIAAGAITVLGLAAYWVWYDQSLQSASRYPLRTLLLVFTPIFGAIAAAIAARNSTEPGLMLPMISPALSKFLHSLAIQRTAGIGALFLVMLVHVVETTKFIMAWQDYKAAVRGLAQSESSDPQLGDGRFVSSQRLGERLNRLSWYSTTHYLSILLTPGYRPRRMVVDPYAGYYWLSCSMAKKSEAADRVMPAESRTLVRIHACHNRPN